MRSVHDCIVPAHGMAGCALPLGDRSPADDVSYCTCYGHKEANTAHLTTGSIPRRMQVLCYLLADEVQQHMPAC